MEYKKIKLSNLIWPNEIPSIFADIEAEYLLKDQIIKTRGVDFNFDTAKEKAISELVERITLIENKDKNSNGYAAHITEKLSRESSLQELLERDAFFCHYYTQEGMTKMSLDDLPVIVAEVLKKLEAIGIVGTAYKLDGILPYHYCAFIFEGKNHVKKFSYTLGLSCDQKQEDSVLKAFIEAIRTLAGYLNHYTANFDEKSLPEIHQRRTFDPEDGKVFKIFFDKSNEKKRKRQSVEDFKIKTELIEQSFSKWHFVTKSSSLELQDLSFGELKKESINLARLEQFAGRSLEIENILSLPPHPLG